MLISTISRASFLDMETWRKAWVIMSISSGMTGVIRTLSSSPNLKMSIPKLIDDRRDPKPGSFSKLSSGMLETKILRMFFLCNKKRKEKREDFFSFYFQNASVFKVSVLWWCFKMSCCNFWRTSSFRRFPSGPLKVFLADLKVSANLALASSMVMGFLLRTPNLDGFVGWISGSEMLTGLANTDGLDGPVSEGAVYCGKGRNLNSAGRNSVDMGIWTFFVKRPCAYPTEVLVLNIGPFIALATLSPINLAEIFFFMRLTPMMIT